MNDKREVVHIWRFTNGNQGEHIHIGAYYRRIRKCRHWQRVWDVCAMHPMKQVETHYILSNGRRWWLRWVTPKDTFPGTPTGWTLDVSSHWLVRPNSGQIIPKKGR